MSRIWAKAVNEVGNRYGMLLVIKKTQCAPNGAAKWVCLCDCGQTKEIRGGHLRNGLTKSCGCLAIKRNKEFLKTCSRDFRGRILPI